MIYKRNKNRKHTCKYCGFSDLNNYYGVKSYDEMPIYLTNLYEMNESKCVWCDTEFYYLTKKEDLLEVK